MNADGVFLGNGYADCCPWWGRAGTVAPRLCMVRGLPRLWQHRVGVAWARREKGEVTLELPEAQGKVWTGGWAGAPLEGTVTRRFSLAQEGATATQEAR